MMMKRISLLLIFALLVSSLARIGPVANAADTEGSNNLIPNPGFESTVTNDKWLNNTAPSNWGEWMPTPGGILSVSENVYHSGNKALKIDHPVEARTNVSINGGVAVEGGKEYTLGAWFKTDNIVSASGVIFRTYYYQGSTKLADGPRVYLKGTIDWTNKELSIDVPTDADVLRVEIMFETGTGTVWVDDVSLTPSDVLLTDVELNTTSLELAVDEQYTLDVAFTPAEAVDTTVVWSSSDSGIVEVDQNGTLTAKSEGSAIIKVSTTDGVLYDECTVNVVASSEVGVIPNPGFENTVEDTDWLNNTAPAGWGVWFATAGGIVSVSEDEYHSGNKALKIDQPIVARTNVSINGGVAVEAGQQYTLGFWIKKENIVSDTGVLLRTYYYNGSTKVADGPRAYLYSGTMDWTYNELSVVVPSDTDTLRVELMFETGTGTVWMDDVSLRNISDLQTVRMDQGSVSISPGQDLTVTPLVYPEAPEHSFVWTSSDSAVATVTDGVVHGIAEGRTLIQAVSEDGDLTAETSVSVIPEADMQSFTSLRERMFKKVTVPDGVDPDSDIVKQVVDQKMALMHNDQNTGFLDKLDRSEDRTYLWEDRSDESDPYLTLYSFGRLKDMAFVYSVPSSPLYGDADLREDILGGIDWLYLNRYNEDKPVVGNWFVWEIAVPQAFGELMILMYDELSQEQLNNYARAIDHFLPDPTKRVSLTNPDFRETGANLLNKSYAVALRGLVGDSSEKIEQALAPVGNEYRYVTEGEGLYADGSIIQHTNVAYTGGYGQSYISQAELLLYMFHDSPWELTDPLIQNVYDSIESVFDPFIFNGRFMQMVNGRGSSEGAGNAKGFILAALQLAESASPEKALPLKQIIKAWLLEDKTNDYETGLTVYQRSLYDQLMNDPKIVPRDERIKYTQFANMDRVLHERAGWKLGLSLFSERVSAFEYGNTENIKGWFTGAGMTYLYDADKEQYGDGYWPAVDSFRLPGTTTDRSGEGVTPVEWGNYADDESWVGGSSIEDLYGASGMAFSMSKVTGSSLSGKKSWFMFDDEVFAMGTDIASTDDGEVETIVDNRKIKDDGSNEWMVDGVVKSSELGSSETLDNPEWVHLDGNVEGSEFGYVFPDNQNIKAIREARTGSYYELNHKYGTDIQVNSNFVSLAFEHGDSPVNGSYAYILLPGKSSEQTANYSKHPDVTILSQTSEVHAVQESSLGITAANFWTAGKAGLITSNDPASVMVQETSDNSLSFSVSDPTQKQTTIELQLDKSAASVVSMDSRIEVIQLSPTIKLSVDVEGAMGESLTGKLKLVADSDSESGENPDGGSGTPSNPVVNTPGSSSLTYSQGAIRSIPELTDGRAVTKLTDDILKEAFEQATPDSKGILETIVKVSTVDGAAQYVQQLPAEWLSSNEWNKRIRLETPIGAVVIPAHMLAGMDIGGQPFVSIVIDAVDKSVIESQLLTSIGDKPVIELHVELGAEPVAWTNPDAAVTVMLPLDPSPQELVEHEHLVVLYLNEQGEAIPVPNGKYDADKQEMSFTTTHFSQYAVAFVQKSFLDTGKYAWAEKEIEVLASKGIINGVTASSFAPGEAITRADFVLLLVRALELQAEESEPFADVRPGDYYYEELGIARAAGLVNGRGDNRFAPEEEITRQEMMVLAHRALLLADKGLESGQMNDLQAYKDVDQLANYAQSAVASLISSGYIQGYNEQLAPLRTTTRAEAAVLLYRMLAD
ncbi:polysaccharide lyase family 8 super-sandwich domain-containing protein [Paenibacillus sp. HB172176]|uniref:polysaccharide lyase family 8 super-sandwich domain-containing protein n=1 Tax=Paenibacillus sp. HB172176 TaxID=2493690 RepID=UPI00197EE448|nr:polysaccharide lyase family 8 super-sandwich domain-containing protein [Paenibacillus sp. HB172176]